MYFVEILILGAVLIFAIKEHTIMCNPIQGRSCKQISWPPGIGGLQGVGLDPGQYDHHPHGLVHVGQLQDVQTVVPVIQEAHLGLTTVSSSVMQFCKLLLSARRDRV